MIDNRTYVFGEGVGPVFSPDGRMLALGWATNPSITVDEDLEFDENTTEECLVEWAKVRVHELPDGPARICAVRVRVPATSLFEREDRFYPEPLELTSEELRFGTGWGEQVRIVLPLGDSVIVDGPADRAEGSEPVGLDE